MLPRGCFAGWVCTIEIVDQWWRVLNGTKEYDRIEKFSLLKREVTSATDSFCSCKQQLTLMSQLECWGRLLSRLAGGSSACDTAVSRSDVAWGFCHFAQAYNVLALATAALARVVTRIGWALRLRWLISGLRSRALVGELSAWTNCALLCARGLVKIFSSSAKGLGEGFLLLRGLAARN